MFAKSVAFFALASLAGLATAQPDGPMPPLAKNPKDTSQARLMGKAFLYREIPLKADTGNGVRGQQVGYNQCTNKTAGPDSMCQTLIVNSVQDFCVYGPPKMGTVGDTEAENVAYCSQNTHGARVMPPGTLQGVQFTRTPSYVQVVGFFNQTLINIQQGDDGGELDSGGQDLRGNPMGALVYSNALPGGNNQMTQSRMWHMFTGSGMFCMKLCTEGDHNASGHCRHTLDTIGCYPSNPADYDNIKGKFLSCQGDDMGSVSADSTAIPKSSNCVTYESTKIYPSATDAAPPPAATPTGTDAGSHGTDAGSHGTGTGTGSHGGAPTPGAGGASAPGGGASGTQSSASNQPSITPVPKPTTSQPLTASPSDTNKPNAAVSATASAGLLSVVALLAAAVFA